MDTTKKIFFEIEDRNVESTFNRYKQMANESARAMIGSANQYAQTGREVNKYLEEEIRLREKKSKLEFDERRSDITDRYQREIRKATPEGREKAQKGYEGRMKEVAMDEREFQKQTNLLKSIYDTLVANAREEIRENRKDVEKQVQAFRSGKLKGVSPEEEAKLKVQSEMLGAEGRDKQKSMFSPVFWGTMLGNMIPNALSKVGSMVKADSSERAVNTMLRAIPYVGDAVADIRERAMDAEQTLKTEKYKFEARTGNRGVSFADMGTPYGYTSSDLYTIAEQAATMRGRAGGNVNATINAVALEKAYGLDLGKTMQSMRTERFGGGGAMNDIGVIIAALKNQGLWDENSQTKIPEYLSILVQLQEEQVKKGGTVNNAQNLANLSAMAKLGDKYFRDTTYVSGISNAIAAPKNEFQQARSLAVLANLNPGADLWQLEMMQEKGLGQKGYMSGLVNMIKSRYGTGSDRAENMGAQAFYQMVKGQGISKADADKIYKQSLRDRTLWEGVTDDESYRKMLDTMGVFTTDTRSLAKSRVPELTKNQARTMEKFSQGAVTGTADLLQQTGQKMRDNLMEGANMIKESIRESMNDFKQNLKESVKEAFEGLKFWKKNETAPE